MLRPIRMSLARGQAWLVPLSLLIAVAAGVWQLARIVDTYGRNVFCWDEWGITRPLYQHAGIATIALQQDGPHREGAGILLQWAVLSLSGWSDRAEGYFLVGLLAVCALLALLLVRRLCGRWILTDAAVPLLILTPAQSIPLITNLHFAHSFVPLLLVLLSGHAWLMAGPARYLAILLLNLLAVFTGFGLFLGPITIALLFCTAIHARPGDRFPAWLACGMALLTMVAFFIGWQFRPANPYFGKAQVSPGDYLVFIGRLIGHSFQAGAVIGLGVFVVLVSAALWSGTRFARKPDGPLAVLFLLTAFSVLYALATTAGRASEGMATALGSQYVTLLLPGLIGLYGVVRRFRFGYPILPAGCLAIALWSFPLRSHEEAQAISWAGFNDRFAATYLQTGSLEAAERAAGHTVFPPDKPGRGDIAVRLEDMRRHGWSFFHSASR